MSGFVVFTKDWNDIPTSGMHIPWRLGKIDNLLWISSIGTRKPALSSGRDMGRIFKRLKSIFSKANHKKDKIWVKVPVLLPKASSKLEITINRWLLKWQLKGDLKRLRISNPEVWSFVPNSGDYIDIFDPSKKVYYCVDDWGEMKGLDKDWIQPKEDDLLSKCDWIFATSKYLQSKLQKRTSNTINYAPHGVDFEHFSKAVDRNLPIPTQAQSLRRPLVGFIGTLDHRIDLELLSNIIKALTDFDFVFIGPERVDFSSLKQFSNAHFLGLQPYSILPDFCQAFECAIIPYKANDIYNQSINPIKVKEFLAAGVPVIASGLPELSKMPHVTIAGSLEQWIKSISNTQDSCDRHTISSSVQADSWDKRFLEIRSTLEGR